MSRTSLAIVPTKREPDPMEAVREMQAQARTGALTIASTIALRAERLAAEAEALANIGDALPAGAREAARQLANALHGNANTLRSILERVK